MIRYGKQFLLSGKGSTRATAYEFSNKSVTLYGKTHVVWLDAIAQVCGRTYDHATQSWSEAFRLFEGCDNHTSPALTADKNGRLRLAYGPHGVWEKWNHGQFKWAISERPGRIDSWTGEHSFGYSATYACMVHTPSGLDVIVYRGGEKPASLMFQKQRVLGGWTTAREIMRQEIEPQYTHNGATIVCDAQGALYVAGHFYNDRTDGKSAGVAVLKSTDMGESWTDMRGEVSPVPICYCARFAIPHGGEGDLTVAGLAVDSRGKLWVSTSWCLSYWSGDKWESIDLSPFLPEDRRVQYGPITIDSGNRIHMVVGLNKADAVGEAWGHTSREVFHLVSRDRGTSFECNQVSTPDESMANWLPNISLAGPFHPVEKPVILYTHGVPGKGCSPLTETEVYCVMVEELD